MGATRSFSERALNEATYAILSTSTDNVNAALAAWEAVRVKICASALPDPGPMDDAEYLRLLAGADNAGREEEEKSTPVLEFLAQGAADYEVFEVFDVTVEAAPPYQRYWPVLTLGESGEVAVSLPHGLLPHLMGLRIRDGQDLCRLEFVHSAADRSPGASRQTGDDVLRGTEPSSDVTSAGPAARGRVPMETARRLLALRHQRQDT